MIKLENTEVSGFKAAIRGMRNPMNSWEKSDSVFWYDNGPVASDILDRPVELCCEVDFDWKDCGHELVSVGLLDYDLMYRLARAGSTDAKYRRMLNVTVDITAPLYWWKEFDTYKVGTVANSCSTMHKIHAKEFTMDDFSHDHIDDETLTVTWDNQYYTNSAHDCLYDTVAILNTCRDKYLETKDKKYWYQMIQLLPTSYNQKRTVQLNYEVLAAIYPKRKNHKLDEWHDFCDWIKELPYSELIILEEE